MGIVVNGDYFENFTFSNDPEKNIIMGSAYFRESELVQEYGVLESKAFNWVVDSRCPDFDGESIEEYYSWRKRMHEIEKEIASLLDGTSVTKEEYEAAKKNLS